MWFRHHDPLLKTAEKILGFKQLPRGWHYGEGVAPSDDVVRKALELNREAGMNGFVKTDAFPGAGGELQVTAYLGTHYIECTIEPDGEITFVREESKNVVVYEERLSFEEAVYKIRESKERIWALSGLSTQSITIRMKEGSQALPSKNTGKVVAFPSSTRNVQYRPAEQYARTSGGSTRLLRQVTLPSYGTFPPRS